MIGEPVTDAQLTQVLALGDVDKDGKINYEGIGIFQVCHCFVTVIMMQFILYFQSS